MIKELFYSNKKSSWKNIIEQTDTKTCSMRIVEKHTNKFYKKFRECRDCNRARRLNGFYEKKDKISNQQKIYYEKNREKIFLQKQNNRCIQIRDFVRSYVE